MTNEELAIELESLLDIVYEKIVSIIDTLEEAEEFSTQGTSDDELVDEADELDEVEELEEDEPSWPNVSPMLMDDGLHFGMPTVGPSWPNVAPPDERLEGDPTSLVWPNVATVEEVSTQPSWPNTQGVTFTQTTCAPQAPSGTPEDTPEETSDILREIVTRDSRGRACLPAEFTRRLGLAYDADLWVALRAGGPGLMLLPYEPSSGVVTNYYVDKWGNVRLSGWALAQGGLTTSRIKFRITNNNRGVVVLPA